MEKALGVEDGTLEGQAEWGKIPGTERSNHVKPIKASKSLHLSVEREGNLPALTSPMSL